MRQKVGEYLLDISKLVFAGMALSAIMEMDGISNAAVVAVGASATIGTAIIGFALIRRS